MSNWRSSLPGRNPRQTVPRIQNRSATVHLEELVGGALSFYAGCRRGIRGVHVFVAEDRDAAPICSTISITCWMRSRFTFSVVLTTFGGLRSRGRAGRRAAYGDDAGCAWICRKGYLVVCTVRRRWPNGRRRRSPAAETIAVKIGDKISIEVLEQALVNAAFTRVDFVYNPVSIRCAAVSSMLLSLWRASSTDSISFGDEVDSIRRFNISSGLSDKLNRVEIIPDLNAGNSRFGRSPSPGLRGGRLLVLR